MLIMQKTVGIFGTWRAQPNTVLYETAADFGKIAAKQGYSVLTGGYTGIMEAPSKAASQLGGATLGYTWKKLNSQLQPNPHLDKITEFEDLCFRIAALIADSDICVFFPGRIGTYAELGVAVERRSKGELVHPIIVVGDFFEWFFLGLENSNKNLMLPADPPSSSNQLYNRIDTPQAFQHFLSAL